MGPKEHPIKVSFKSVFGRLLLVGLASLPFMPRAYASASLFLEEPYGFFGAVNPTGHAAIYFDHICADSPGVLRPCAEGETGIVISRYHRVAGYDWLAIPLVPYLYGVERVDEIPDRATPDSVARIRDAYRRDHLRAIAPDAPDGKAPEGEWTELVGSSYDRKIYAYQIATTREQEERIIAIFNDRTNKGRYNMLYRNCADLSRNIFNAMNPKSVRRNPFADWGIMTPKQVARSLVGYNKKHPDLGLQIFVIPQVPGTVPRSHAVYGCTEGFVKSKKYVVPAALVNPFIAGGMIALYFTDGRFSPPKHAALFPLPQGTNSTMATTVSVNTEPFDQSAESELSEGDGLAQFER
jgi:hypothetical protein